MGRSKKKKVSSSLRGGRVGCREKKVSACSPAPLPPPANCHCEAAAAPRLPPWKTAALMLIEDNFILSCKLSASLRID